jgi:tRNA threonylcarbamoyladenosine biosynthesis protein TsaE
MNAGVVKGAEGGALWPVEVTTGSPDETRALAAALATLCRAGDVVLLVGDLGAGKTVFAQGFAGALGVAGPVTSPTFALVRHYLCGPDGHVRTLIHADVYRTGSVAEVTDLALAELVEEDAVALVEWGDMAAPALGQSALEVTLVAPDPVASPEARTVAVVGRGRWSGRAGEVASVLEPVAGRRTS